MSSESEPRIRILSVDDHPLLREGIATIIGSQADMLLVAQASNGQEAIRQFREHCPDVTLMDLRLPDMSGIETLSAIRTQFPEARVIMLSTFQGDVEIQRALQAGARGYLLKSMAPKELLDAIRQVHSGKKRIPSEVATHLAEYLAEEDLTSREVEVLQLVAAGNRNKEIAERLFITERFTSSTSWISSARTIAPRRSRSRCVAASFSCKPSATVPSFGMDICEPQRGGRPQPRPPGPGRKKNL